MTNRQQPDPAEPGMNEDKTMAYLIDRATINGCEVKVFEHSDHYSATIFAGDDFMKSDVSANGLGAVKRLAEQECEKWAAYREDYAALNPDQIEQIMLGNADMKWDGSGWIFTNASA
jgi:hypothetical protein